MTETADFGDIELDDLWDEEPPAPEQVARRLHELRAAINDLAGVQESDWDDLSEIEQELAEAIGATICEWIGEHPLVESAGLAEALHNVLNYLNGGGTEWNELSDAEREISTDLVRDIARWLAAEGAWQ